MTAIFINLIDNIHFNMLKYQRINNIENQCILNTEYLYYTLKQYLHFTGITIQIRPVIVILDKNIETNTQVMNTGHLVIQFGSNKIYECSYDIYKHRYNNSFSYIYSIDDLNTLNINPELKTEIIENFNHFNAKATKMNNGEYLYTEGQLQYLHDMANYTEKNVKKFIKKHKI